MKCTPHFFTTAASSAKHVIWSLKYTKHAAALEDLMVSTATSHLFPLSKTFHGSLLLQWAALGVCVEVVAGGSEDKESLKQKAEMKRT